MTPLSLVKTVPLQRSVLTIATVVDHASMESVIVQMHTMEPLAKIRNGVRSTATQMAFAKVGLVSVDLVSVVFIANIMFRVQTSAHFMANVSMISVNVIFFGKGPTALNHSSVQTTVPVMVIALERRVSVTKDGVLKIARCNFLARPIVAVVCALGRIVFAIWDSREQRVN